MYQNCMVEIIFGRRPDPQSERTEPMKKVMSGEKNQPALWKDKKDEKPIGFRTPEKSKKSKNNVRVGTVGFI